MKSGRVTSTSSVTLATTAAASEEKHSRYFPRCRKDASCNCELCLASIRATLDLMPISVQKISLTKLSTASQRPSAKVEVTPISFDSTSTPKWRSPSQVIPMSPELRSSARMNLKKKTGKTKKMKTTATTVMKKKMKTSGSVTSTSSATSATTAAASEEERSCYFPRCHKDANCNCVICLASIRATLDLMPISVQKRSLTKLSTASQRPSAKVEVTPISFDSTSMPKSRSPLQVIAMSPEPRSSARMNLKKKMKTTERQRACFGSNFLRQILVVGLILVADCGFPWAVSGVLKPAISHDTARNIGEKSSAVKDLKGKLTFLQTSLQSLVDGMVSNCSYASSQWEISQDGLLLSSHCKLYKSRAEEIRIWGWPLQTAGLIATGFSSRSFTVLSSRVTEWSDVKLTYVIWKANSTWAHQKWASSAVQFDENTWILEYRRSSVLENPRLVSATLALC